MPFPLHKSPQFLLDLFRLKTVGGSPYAFGETVQPGVDVTSFYGADIQLSSSLVSAAGALPRTATFTVVNPARYLAVATECTLGAAPGTTLRLGVFYRSNSVSVAVPLFWEVFTGAPPLVANTGILVGGMLATPIVAPAGAVFFASASGNAGGADHVVDLRFLSEDPLR